MRILWIAREAEAHRAQIGDLSRRGHSLAVISSHASALGSARVIAPPRWIGGGLSGELALGALAGKEILAARPDAAVLVLDETTAAAAGALRAARVPFIALIESAIRAPGITLTLAIIAAHALVAEDERAARDSEPALAKKPVEIIRSRAPLLAVPSLDRDAAKQSLGLPVEQRFLAITGPLDAALRLDHLADAHRGLAGIGLLVVGDGPRAGFVQAMAMTARPSAPVLDLGYGDAEIEARAIIAADVCAGVRADRLGGESWQYAALGRRQVVLEVAGAEAVSAIYPPELEAVRVARGPDPRALREALAAALESEQRLGLISGAEVALARRRIEALESSLESVLQRVVESR